MTRTAQTSTTQPSTAQTKTKTGFRTGVAEAGAVTRRRGRNSRRARRRPVPRARCLPALRPPGRSGAALAWSRGGGIRHGLRVVAPAPRSCPALWSSRCCTARLARTDRYARCWRCWACRSSAPSAQPAEVAFDKSVANWVVAEAGLATPDQIALPHEIFRELRRPDAGPRAG